MTDNEKCCPPPKDVQDFRFKEESVAQICDEFPNLPVASSLIAADEKRGLLYIGYETKLIVLYPGTGANSQWKLEIDLSHRACRVELNCDCSLLAVTFNQPLAVIYDASSISKHKLDKVHEIRLSSTAGEVFVSDFKWNPAIPDMFCSVTSDHIIGSFQVSKEKGVHVIGREKPLNLEALCVSWSPKGKQIVVGCKNGDIVQLKPELKIARHLNGPNPSEGFIISILWISNYQFCVCFFHADQQRINVMIVDAPKGVTVPKLINYEDLTFGGGPTDRLSYYFEHIPEWGIIIAASTHSSELAVLGTEDNGATWNVWQLIEGSTVQLPLNRKKKTENYPVGLAIDKSPNQRLPWGTDSTLPNPVPILRILVTSGQMCSYHMINLKDNVPVLCSPPIEIIPAPALPRPSLGPSEVSFNLPSGATSTPQKQNLAASQIDKTKVATNMFGNLAGSNFSFSTLGNAGAPEPTAESQMKGFAPSTEIKMAALFGQGDGKSNLFPQNIATMSKQPFEIQQIKSPSMQQPGIQPQTIEFSANKKIDPKPVSLPQVESKVTKELAKEVPQTHADEIKSPTKAAPIYDEGICLQAFHEEQARFEKELRIKLELPTWDCGSEDEQQFLAKKTDEMDAFFKELQETTNSLASDVAYLKALLLQSFAWIEETKSKSSANTSFGGRNHSEGSKLAELQRLFDYTQTQLTQATKVLDLEWAEYNNREMSKMKIPSLEIIYQSLIKHTQIITQQKKIMEELTKKWRSIARGDNNLSGVTDLDRSMASLNLSQFSNTTVNNVAIELRCKLIASNTRNFTKEKQIKLRDLLMVTEPKIVPAMKPTAVQERLQATLSSLASLKATEASIKAKPSKAAVERQQVQKPQAMGSPVDQMRGKLSSNPILSLDNIVSGLGTQSGLSKSPSSIAPFSTMSTKPNFTSPQKGWAKDNTSFTPNVPSLQASTANKAFSFSSPVQKSTESQGVLKENLVKAAFDDGSAKFPSFAGGTFAKQPDPPGTTAASTGAATTPMFNFTASNQGFAGLSKPENGGTFKFSTKTTAPNINFAGLSTTTTPPTAGFTASPSFSFGNASVSPPQQQQQQQQSKVQQQQQQQQTPNFGRTISTSTSPTTATSQASTTGSTGQFSFGKTTMNVPAATAASISPEKSISATSPLATISSTAVAHATATTTAPSSIFGTGSTTLFGSLSITPLPSSPISGTTGQATATTTIVTSVATKVSSPSTISTTASSTPSFAGLLGATASLSFGTTPNATVSSTVPTFGNVFAGNATTAKADAAVSNDASSPFGGSPIGTATSATSIFCSTNTTTTSGNSSIFGGQSANAAGGNSFFSTKAPATTTTASSTSVFGAVSTSTPSMFGGNSATAAPAFASNATTQPSNVFGRSVTTQSSGASIFGATATTQSSVFGAASTTPSTAGSIFGASGTQSTASSIFGTSATQVGSGSVFGAASGTPVSGTSIFGATAAQSAPVFGAAATIASPAFGATTVTAATTTTATTTAASSIFGGSSSPAAPSSSLFGASSSSAFGTSAATTGSIFCAAATTASSLFGAPAAAAAAAAATTTPSIFGAAAPTTTTPSMFGSPVATTAAGGSIFGAASSQPATGVFGSPSPAGAGSVFGAPPALGGGTSMFGGAASPSMFGQSSAFGAKPVFGTATTGFGSPGGTSGFGSPPAFGTSPGFGSPPAFGAATTQASTSPSKVFGSNTFETLGTQSGGLSFGSLAQGTPQQQQEQKPTFQGSSSFSSWR